MDTDLHGCPNSERPEELQMNADLQKKETGKKHGSSWQNYKRRRFSFLVIWLTYVPGVFVLGYPLSRLFHSGIPIYILAGAWMVALIASANYMELFPCPRCQRAFFRTFWFHNPWARRCVHCGFPKWSDSTAEYERAAYQARTGHRPAGGLCQRRFEVI